MLTEYIGVIMFVVIMIGAGVFFVALSHLVQIRVKGDKYDWSRPYECGIRSEGFIPGRYPVHYYIVGILFVIFDVETVFLIPWAVIGHEFKAAGQIGFWLIEMLVFIVILLVGYFFLLKRGVFDWGHEEHAGGESK